MHADTRAALNFSAALRRALQLSPQWQSTLGLAAEFNELTYLHFNPSPPNRCQYRTCNKPPVKRSHVLARGSVLEPLATDGHVLTPRRRHDGVLELERIGIKSASTLPLYCLEHEGLFGEFERDKAVSTPRHVVLQLMRSTARELVKTQQFVEYLDQMEFAYSTAAANALLVEPRIAADLDAACEALRQLSLEMNSLSAELHWTKRDLEDWTRSESNNELPLNVFYNLMPNRIGFALSSSTMLHPVNAHRFPIVLVAAPNDTHTIIMGCTSAPDAVSLQMYFFKFFLDWRSTSVSLIDWLGTGHWFASPTWWSGLSQAQQEKVLSLLSLAE